ncbi:zinc/manganese transport system ATP-binding protein [Rhizobium skierniewicense]|uniref:Zinc/manganese transport system ATP-binding protein n=1 Tax=Rhizobium skierniewicense TaxID=984260 RepID=A0A7W6C3E1_9HYPH|nr:ABC transporter ATP-binding protein [Rhizobium skierniewicense]MBB3945025.1 zinc/manganese transport system ATP-binding protein [Rhizobium skierniewicense]
MTGAAVLTIDNLTVAYNRHPAVHHVSGSFNAGSLTAIAGPNGAGKSTLLKAIIGDLKASEGSIMHTLKRAEFGYLPQAADINRRFPISVSETVLLGSWKTAGAFGTMGKADEVRAQDALATVGLAGFENRSISALSAGQFQRVLFARLLLQDASVILLDEPFTAIDARTTRDLLDIVSRWHGEGRTVVAVLHDFEQVRSHFPETLLIARELIAWGPTQQVMSPINLMRARTMSERWDDNSVVCEPAA